MIVHWTKPPSISRPDATRPENGRNCMTTELAFILLLHQSDQHHANHFITTLYTSRSRDTGEMRFRNMLYQQQQLKFNDLLLVLERSPFWSADPARQKVHESTVHESASKHGFRSLWIRTMQDQIKRNKSQTNVKTRPNVSPTEDRTSARKLSALDAQ